MANTADKNKDLDATAEEVVAEAGATPEDHPDDEQPSDKVALAEDLVKAQQLVEEFKEALQRERADFQNFRRRTEKERETLRPQVTIEVMKRFLPVIDDMERGIDVIPEEEKSKDWVVGIIQIQRKFRSLLDAEGIQEINPLGEPFDPNFHEAIGADEPTDDYESGTVTAVLQKGYQKDAQVLRPAMVRVAN